MDRERLFTPITPTKIIMLQQRTVQEAMENREIEDTETFAYLH